MTKPGASKNTHLISREFSAGRDEVLRDLIAGLSAKQARISPKYFYSALGSKLFEAICALDEYYPTRVEAGIYDAFGAEIAAAAGHGTTLIDLGAGNCAKAARLFDVLCPQTYVPVDISVEFLTNAVMQLQRAHPGIAMQPVGLDFAETFQLPGHITQQNRLFFYPGSSIGNFTPLQAAQFLRRLRAVSHGGALLIGIDLIKDEAIMQAAYDDALGVTAAFNLNVLRHVNVLLGTDFDARVWRHVALFNAEQSRIEMHLEAKRDVDVHWPGGGRRFAEGERIHTENSYKYTKRGFVELLAASGFGEGTCWSDAHEQFMVCHARAV